MKKILPVYPWPLPVKAAEMLRDFPVTPVQASPGGPGPVLAFGKSPTWIADHVVVKSPQALSAVVAFLIADDAELVTMADMLSGPSGVAVSAVKFS